MNIKQQIKFIELCKDKINLIAEITEKADVKTKMIYNPSGLYLLIVPSFVKRTIKKIIIKCFQ